MELIAYGIGKIVPIKSMRESAISALALMTYQVEITGAGIAVIAIPVAHTRERVSK